jgi:hypothetical protein
MKRSKLVGDGVILFVVLMLLLTIYACPYLAVYPYLSVGAGILVIAIILRNI